MWLYFVIFFFSQLEYFRYGAFVLKRCSNLIILNSLFPYRNNSIYDLKDTYLTCSSKFPGSFVTYSICKARIRKDSKILLTHKTIFKSYQSINVWYFFYLSKIYCSYEFKIYFYLSSHYTTFEQYINV